MLWKIAQNVKIPSSNESWENFDGFLKITEVCQGPNKGATSISIFFLKIQKKSTFRRFANKKS